jgi:uncharacterized protein YjbI with pentapeptide repeats
MDAYELRKLYASGQKTFTHVDLIGISLYGTKLPGINIVECNLSDANLSRVDLRESNFSRTNLHRVNFSGSNLWEADLSETNLAEANLATTDLRRANLSNADLNGATYDISTKFDEDFEPEARGMQFVEKSLNKGSSGSQKTPTTGVDTATSPYPFSSAVLPASPVSPLLTFHTGEGTVSLDLAQVLGILGALLLFIGVFTPLVRLPVVGSINALRNGSGDGIILIALAFASLVFIFRKTYQWLWVSGVGAGATIILNFLVLQFRISEIKSNIDQELQGNPFRGLADIAAQSIQIEWGWGLLFVGAVLIVASAYLKKAVLDKKVLIGVGIIGILAFLLVLLNPTIQSDFSDIEGEDSEQVQRARGSEARSTLGMINRAQQAFQLENNYFARSLNQLDAVLSPKYYQYEIIEYGVNLVITKATPSQSELKSYISGVFMGDFPVYFSQIICESDRPGKDIEKPSFIGDDWVCGSGSTSID